MSFIKAKDTVTIYHNGRVVTIGINFAESSGAMNALRNGDYAKAILLADRATAIKQRSGKNGFVVDNGVVFRNGQPVHNTITKRILEFVENGLPFKPLLNFLENLSQNPSQRAVTESYYFLEHQNLPVTEDGCFLAYKVVQSNFYSKSAGSLTLLKGKADASGHIYNGVGEEIECVRNEVDDEKDRTCSRGLHAGALAYAGPQGSFFSNGNKVVIVKINPRDIVSVPSDCNAQKLRVCRYEVISEFVSAYEEPLTNSKGSTYTRSAVEATCDEDAGGCGWEGRIADLDYDYTCPACDSNAYVEAL